MVCEYELPTVPFGSVGGASVIAGAWITIVYSRLPVLFCASRAVAVNVNDPACVGVPEIVALVPATTIPVKPGGRAPVVIEPVYGGPTPPEAVTVCE
jgi:hypothetical protein